MLLMIDVNINVLISYVYCLAYYMTENFMLQKKNLKALFDEKVKKLVEKILALHGYPERSVKTLNNVPTLYIQVHVS